MHDRSGRLLIPAGMVLQDKQIRVLRSWGICTVDVVEDAQDTDTTGADTPPPRVSRNAPNNVSDTEQPTSVMEEQVDRALADRFRHCDVTHYPMDGIYRLARQRLLEELVQCGGRAPNA
ncbi:hypothetical protein [Thioalkalivibrio sp. ALJT]|uniref:hypothetical protein n=1 Tax=Thioalkalivibrio sp. ALJT TaxID=1158146 RepID=UPI0003823AD5